MAGKLAHPGQPSRPATELRDIFSGMEVPGSITERAVGGMLFTDRQQPRASAFRQTVRNGSRIDPGSLHGHSDSPSNVLVFVGVRERRPSPAPFNCSRHAEASSAGPVAGLNGRALWRSTPVAGAADRNGEVGSAPLSAAPLVYSAPLYATT